MDKKQHTDPTKKSKKERLPRINTTPFFYPVYDNDNSLEGTVSDGAAARIDQRALYSFYRNIAYQQPTFKKLLSMNPKLFTEPYHEITYEPNIEQSELKEKILNILFQKKSFTEEELNTAIEDIVSQGAEVILTPILSKKIEERGYDILDLPECLVEAIKYSLSSRILK